MTISSIPTDALSPLLSLSRDERTLARQAARSNPGLLDDPIRAALATIEDGEGIIEQILMGVRSCAS